MNDLAPPASKVLNWLKKQGYSLEMRVAQAFKQARFDVSQSQAYHDPGSDELREIGVVASMNRRIGMRDVWVSLFRECKFLSKPWVIFTSPRHVEPLSHFARMLSGHYDIHEWRSYESLQGRLLARVLSSIGRRRMLDFAFFSVPESLGYNMTEALRERSRARDNAYQAIMQLSSCL